MARRKRQHKRKPHKGLATDLIPDDYEWEMRQLEECNKETKANRERYWFETLHPLLNKQIPGRSKSEVTLVWAAENAERNNENRRKWIESNRDKVNKYQRDYRAAKKLSG